MCDTGKRATVGRSGFSELRRSTGADGQRSSGADAWPTGFGLQLDGRRPLERGYVGSGLGDLSCMPLSEPDHVTHDYRCLLFFFNPNLFVVVQRWVSRHQTQEFRTETRSQDPAKTNSLRLGTGETLVITRILALHLPRRGRKEGNGRRSTLIN